MKLIFYSATKLDTFLNKPVESLDSVKDRLFLPEKPTESYPPLSVSLLKSVPKDKLLLYDIHSLDCCLDINGNFSTEKLSEDKAFELSKTSIIYRNDFHLTPYFRYKGENCQHTVWLEDTYHQIKKLDYLASLGLQEVGILINSISCTTVINLIRTERYCV